jgi:hypothetical protein
MKLWTFDKRHGDASRYNSRKREWHENGKWSEKASKALPVKQTFKLLIIDTQQGLNIQQKWISKAAKKKVVNTSYHDIFISFCPNSQNLFFIYRSGSRSWPELFNISIIKLQQC